MKHFSNIIPIKLLFILLSISANINCNIQRFEGKVLKVDTYRFEKFVTIENEDGRERIVRFQLAVEGKSGFDPFYLESLNLVGKNILVELGPHNVVLKCYIFENDEKIEVKKAED